MWCWHLFHIILLSEKWVANVKYAIYDIYV
jgi:hypothetical protein